MVPWSYLFYNDFRDLFYLFPVRYITFIVRDVICRCFLSHLRFNQPGASQFSVTIGLTSRTTTVTLRTARVLANSSPTPDAPVKQRSSLWSDIGINGQPTNRQ